MTKGKKIRIKDAYLELMLHIMYDYDGCETVEDLKKLIDEMCVYAGRAIRCETKTKEYTGCNGKDYNILHEEIK